MIGLLRWLGDAAVRHWSIRRGRRQLCRLDDRMLADMGISRGFIESAVRGFDPVTAGPLSAMVGEICGLRRTETHPAIRREYRHADESEELRQSQQ